MCFVKRRGHRQPLDDWALSWWRRRFCSCRDIWSSVWGVRAGGHLWSSPSPRLHFTTSAVKTAFHNNSGLLRYSDLSRLLSITLHNFSAYLNRPLRLTCWTHKCPLCFQTGRTLAPAVWEDYSHLWCGPSSPGGKQRATCWKGAFKLYKQFHVLTNRGGTYAEKHLWPSYPLCLFVFHTKHHVWLRGGGGSHIVGSAWKSAGIQTGLRIMLERDKLREIFHVITRNYNINSW